MYRLAHKLSYRSSILHRAWGRGNKWQGIPRRGARVASVDRKPSSVDRDGGTRRRAKRESCRVKGIAASSITGVSFLRLTSLQGETGVAVGSGANESGRCRRLSLLRARNK